MKTIILTITLCALFGCTKKLDLKPESTIVIPKTIGDFENILDNTEIMNSTPALAQLSADEYFIPNLQSWQAIEAVTQRNAYTWEKDIYQAETRLKSWYIPYSAIFYANNVLDLLEKQDLSNNPEMKNIKGWALFTRAYAFYSLASTFCKAYDPGASMSDLGIPLKLSPDIDKILLRSSLQQTYDQIIEDVTAASDLLRHDISTNKRNRPSKVAAFALLSRIYLSMRKYDLAELNADKTLALFSTLTNYNSLAISNRSSFTYNSAETIYYTQQILEYGSTTLGTTILYGIDTALIKLYEPADLRLKIYFKQNAIGNQIIKGINSIGYPFTGLATDEIYLIKAECLARRQQQNEAITLLNTLVRTRYETNKFTPITATNPEEALEKVLIERRKALIWRSLRWTDLKRLNLEGKAITLKRNLGGQSYTLAPNSPKYVMPIPADEIVLTGIQQNIR